MTIKELSQLFYLKKEIERDTMYRVELKSKAEKITSAMLGLPASKNEQSKVEHYAIEITDLDEMIRLNIQKCFYEEKRIRNYIDSIGDSRTRLMFKLRFIDCMSWNEVADMVGGYNTEDSIRMAVNRYIKSCSICSVIM